MVVALAGRRSTRPAGQTVDNRECRSPQVDRSVPGQTQKGVNIARAGPHPTPPAADDLDGWERAVAHLVTAVGDRTQYESAWYACCTTVLGWFLEAAGIARGEHGKLLEHAIGGKFASWVEPDRKLVASVAERLARQVTGA